MTHELRDELLSVLADAIELAEESGRPVLAADLKTARNHLLICMPK